MRDDDTIVDAEFETIAPTADGTSPSGAFFNISAKGAAGTSTNGLALAGSHERARPGLGIFARTANLNAGKSMPLPLFVALAIIGPLAAFLLAGGHVFLPKNADLASQQTNSVITPAITLEDVSTRVDSSGPRPVLIVRGTLVNQSRRIVSVPPVRIRTGTEPGAGIPVHAVARVATLQPGARLAFTSRLPAGETVPIAPRIEIGHP